MGPNESENDDYHCCSMCTCQVQPLNNAFGEVCVLAQELILVGDDKLRLTLCVRHVTLTAIKGRSLKNGKN